MPGGLMFSDRNLVLAAGSLSLAMIVATVTLAPDRTDSDVPTTYSSGSGGAKAVYLMLEASRYRVKRWERPLRDLPLAPSTLILAEPEGFPTFDERVALERFAQRGSTVIATGVSGGSFLLGRRIVEDPAAGSTWSRLSARSPSAVTRAAPEIALALRAYWDAQAFAMPLYGDGDKVRVVKYESGNGEIFWWASATPLTNAGVREPGNLEFVLASIGGPERPVLFDEYFHGHRNSPSATFADGPLKWFGSQLALAAVAVLVTFVRRSGPVVTAPPESRLSPLEFVRSLGSLYRQAGAATVAVGVGTDQLRYQLTRKLGMSSKASADDIELAARNRWNVDGLGIGDLLRACDGAREELDLSERAALKLTRALWEQSRKLDLSTGTAREHV